MTSFGPGMARLAACTALLGALIVIVSQVVAGYSMEDQFGVVIANVTLLDKHGPITAIFGLAAAVAVTSAIALGSRPAAMVVIGLGVAVILIFLLVDLPDLGDTGMYDAPGAGVLDAEGAAAPGLWLELTGGIVLVLGGAALSLLSDRQLREIGPGPGGR